MATERQAPDAVLLSTNYTTLNVTDIDEDPDSPDASYGTWDGNGNTDARVSFPTPTGSPTVGAGLQEFRVLIRRNGATTNAGWALELWENGALVSSLATGTLTNTTPVVVSGTWNASLLGTANGSLVECRLDQTSGGTGGTRSGVEVGAVEWNVNYLVITNSYAQAQARILSTTNIYAQSQADIRQTYNKFAQSQADIKQIYQGYAQAHVDILQVYQGYAQARTSILQSYFGFAQAQTDIKRTYNSFAQALGLIGRDTSLYTYIDEATANDLDYLVWPMASTSSYEAKLTSSGTPDFLQGHVIRFRAHYFGSPVDFLVQLIETSTIRASTQVSLTTTQTTYEYSLTASEIASITSYGDLRLRFTPVNPGDTTRTMLEWAELQLPPSSIVFIAGYAQAQALIRQTYNNFAQAQSDILQVYQGYGQGQTFIIYIQQRYSQAQADIGQIYQGYSQAQAHIFQIYFGFAQAQSTIISGSHSFAQAQGDITATYLAFAQAQVRILQVYQTYGQAQASILVSQQNYGQAQAQIQGRAYGQAQASILVTSSAFAQAQANISHSYQGYGQSQSNILQTYFGFGQALAVTINSYLNFAQAQAYTKVNINKFALAKGRIKQTTNKFGTANARIIYKPSQHAQAQAIIKVYPIGNAQALIDSIHKNNSAQAQAFICWIDTYTRSEPFGLGTDYTWFGVHSSFNAAGDSTYGVDGSQVIDLAPTQFNTDDYHLNRTAPTTGSATFEFTTNSTFVDYPYVALTLGQDYGARITYNGLPANYGFINVAIYSDGPGNQWFISPWWSAADFLGLYTSDVGFDILPNKTYRVKMVYDSDGYMAAKVWDTSGSEPDWMLVGQFLDYIFDNPQLTSWHYVPYRALAPTPANNPLLDFYFTPDIVSFDNLDFCIPEPFPKYEIKGFAQAVASITNTTPAGNAQADILQTNQVYAQAQALLNTGFGIGNAKAKIQAIGVSKSAQAKALILQTLPFIDTFDNRVTTDPDVLGLEQPYVWPGINVFGSVLYKRVYVDGQQIVIPANGVVSGSPQKADAYWLPITRLPTTAFMQFDVYTGSGTRVNYVPMFSLSGKSTAGGMLDVGIRWDTTNNKWEVGSIGVGNFSGYTAFQTLSDNTWYTVKAYWTPNGSFFYKYWNRTLGESTATSFSASFAWTSLSYSPALMRVQLIGQETGDDFYVDNIIIGNIWPTGQARAKIKGIESRSGQAQAYIGHFNHAQAQADISQTYNGFAQTRARISVGGEPQEFQVYAQALGHVGQYFGQGYAQAQARVGSRWVFSQAQAQITITWRFAQAQGIINQVMQTGQAQASINVGWGIAQARAVIVIVRRVRGDSQAWILIKRWTWAQAQAFIIPRVGVSQAQAQIITFGYSKLAQAQAYIGSYQFGNAGAQIKFEGSIVCGQAAGQIGPVGARSRFAQARAFIFGSKIRPAQANALIRYNLSRLAQAQSRINGYLKQPAQAQAQIVGSTIRCGQARSFIKRTIEHGQAQGWITRTTPGYLVKYNGYVLPGYLQSEALISEMSIYTMFAPKFDFSTYSEYTGLRNKLITIKMLVADSTYMGAKAQINKASTMLRSSRKDFVQLILKRPDRYYEALTRTITTEQTAGHGENNTPYEVTFEAKPWQYGNWHTLTGTIDTNNVNRTITNGTWTPAIVTLTGTDITVSGYSGSEFTGYISVSGHVENLVVDTENFSATINGINKNELMNIDYGIYIAPGRTQFAVTGATDITVEYQDRWPL